ncbi:hypothetical protein HHK36_017233 [Tetracentron sinense]|uniref:NAD(P)-binding domain-containing protein n=1 Tax=Tetracentron sinense TaxID=13715 RepID=A0A834Z445_TETSI|nr:hypothetical protein HHK36_017233 [Tetracentron sinense]
MASKLSFSSIRDFSFSIEKMQKPLQRTPLFVLPPLNSTRGFCSRSISSARGASFRYAVKEEEIQSKNLEDINNSETTPSSSKFVLVVGGTGGVGSLNASLKEIYKAITLMQPAYGMDLAWIDNVDPCAEQRKEKLENKLNSRTSKGRKNLAFHSVSRAAPSGIPQKYLGKDVTLFSGQLIVASLLNRNIKSRLLIRDPEKATYLFGEQDKDTLQVWKGDTRNPDDLDPAIFEGITHVICCTGTTAFPSKRWDTDNTPERVDWEGVRNLVSAMPPSLKRIVLVSSVGVTKFNELPWSIMNLFGVLKFKKMGEDYVRSYGLPFTIIRPGRLTDGPYTSYDLNTLLKATAGKRRAVVIGQGDKLVGEVSRLVVAEACIQALDIEFTQGQIYEINSVESHAMINYIRNILHVPFTLADYYVPIVTQQEQIMRGKDQKVTPRNGEISSKLLRSSNWAYSFSLVLHALGKPKVIDVKVETRQPQNSVVQMNPV